MKGWEYSDWCCGSVWVFVYGGGCCGMFVMLGGGFECGCGGGNVDIFYGYVEVFCFIVWV